MLDGASHDKLTHSIPVGALVELGSNALNAGVRVWVMGHTWGDRDKPLYKLGLKYDLGDGEDHYRVVMDGGFAEHELRVISVPDPILDEVMHAGDMEGC